MDVFAYVLIFTIPLMFYLLPSILAGFRKHPKFWRIAFLNVLAGWTQIGWLVALVWASRRFGPEAPRE